MKKASIKQGKNEWMKLQTVKEGMIDWAFKQWMIFASNKKAMKQLDQGIEWVRYARQLEP